MGEHRQQRLLNYFHLALCDKVWFIHANLSGVIVAADGSPFGEVIYVKCLYNDALSINPEYVSELENKNGYVIMPSRAKHIFKIPFALK